jgi:hypothetical protein
MKQLIGQEDPTNLWCNVFLKKIEVVANVVTQLRHKIAKVVIYFIFLRWSHFGEFIGFRMAMVANHHLQIFAGWRQS